jgi:amino acid transporter
MQIAGTLRVSPQMASTRASKAEGDDDKDGGTEQSNNPYLTRLTTLFPAEGLSLYGLAQGLFGGGSKDLAIASAIILVLLAFVRFYATRDKKTNKVQWGGIAIALVSYVLWVFTVGGNFDFFNAVPMKLDQKWATFAAAVWTIIVPLVYRGEE